MRKDIVIPAIVKVRAAEELSKAVAADFLNEVTDDKDLQVSLIDQLSVDYNRDINKKKFVDSPDEGLIPGGQDFKSNEDGPANNLDQKV
jgi:hypothetical protein